MCDYDTDEELETKLLFRKPKSSKELQLVLCHVKNHGLKKNKKYLQKFRKNLSAKLWTRKNKELYSSLMRKSKRRGRRTSRQKRRKSPKRKLKRKSKRRSRKRKSKRHRRRRSPKRKLKRRSRRKSNHKRRSPKRKSKRKSKRRKSKRRKFGAALVAAANKDHLARHTFALSSWIAQLPSRGDLEATGATEQCNRLIGTLMSLLTINVPIGKRTCLFCQLPIFMNCNEAKAFDVTWMPKARWVRLKFVLSNGQEVELKIDCEHLIPVKTLSILIFNGKKINVKELTILKQIIDAYNIQGALSTEASECDGGGMAADDLAPRQRVPGHAAVATRPDRRATRCEMPAASNKFNMQPPVFGKVSCPRTQKTGRGKAGRVFQPPREASKFPPATEESRKKAGSHFKTPPPTDPRKDFGQYRKAVSDDDDDDDAGGGGGSDRASGGAAQLLADAIPITGAPPFSPETQRDWATLLEAHSKLLGQISVRGPPPQVLSTLELALFFWAHDICNGIKSSLQCIALWIWENCTLDGKKWLLMEFLKDIKASILSKPLAELPYHIEDFMDKFCTKHDLRRVSAADWESLRRAPATSMKNWIWLPEISNILIFLYAEWYGITLKTAADLYVTVSLQKKINMTATSASSAPRKMAGGNLASWVIERAKKAAPTFFDDGQTAREPPKPHLAISRSDMTGINEEGKEWEEISELPPAAHKRQVFSWYLRKKWAYIKWQLLREEGHVQKNTESWKIAIGSHNDKDWWFLSQLRLIVEKFYSVCFAFADPNFQIQWNSFWKQASKNMSKHNIKDVSTQMRNMRVSRRAKGGGRGVAGGGGQFVVGAYSFPLGGRGPAVVQAFNSELQKLTRSWAACGAEPAKAFGGYAECDELEPKSIIKYINEIKNGGDINLILRSQGMLRRGNVEERKRRLTAAVLGQDWWVKNHPSGEKSYEQYLFGGRGQRPLEAQIVAFYAEHNPAKVGEAAELAKKYAGRGDVLFQKLREKYKT